MEANNNQSTFDLIDALIRIERELPIIYITPNCWIEMIHIKPHWPEHQAER